VETIRLEHRRPFVRLMHRGLNLEGYFAAADRALGDLVAFDSSCWLSLDPATLLPTSHFTREINSDHLMELATNEFLQDDVNKFADLARRAQPVGILSQATDGDLARSRRFLQVLAPHGYQDGDELRATFVEGETAWGCVALHRRAARFDGSDARSVAGVAGYIASGIRRAILSAGSRTDGSSKPGVILLASDGSLDTITPAASRWLKELIDSSTASGGLPLIIRTVAEKARQAANGEVDEIATARLPTRAGDWLLLHASLLESGADGRVAVMLYPATQPHVAPLIVEAYRLTAREREVTGCLVRGLSTREMADNLGITSHTVNDHVKAILAKVGVQSRRELVAQLFLRHYAPKLAARKTVAPDGSFASEPVPYPADP
jgi:DNA-binding CsgD family transcriptional regulator